MGSADVDNYSPGSVSRRLLAVLSLDRITLLFDLYRALRLRFNRQRREGMNEILNYDSILELLDTKGETAILKKRQHVKFLQDNVIAFQNYAWGMGRHLWITNVLLALLLTATKVCQRPPRRATSARVRERCL